MSARTMLAREVVAAGAAAAVLLAPASARAARPEAPPAAGQARLSGRVVASDGKAAVVGATVVLYELATGRLERSSPTNAKGEFEFRDLPHGYYDLAVDTPQGLFVGSRVVDVPPSGKEVLTLTLIPQAEAGARPPPVGLGPQSSGQARIAERLRGREFWRSPKGVAILAGGGAAALLLLAASARDEDQATNFLSP